jgi:hypothetical protein
MPILKKTGCVPVLISFFVISMFCLVSMFAPLQWMLNGINLPKLFAAACVMSLIMTPIAFFSLRDISPTKSMLIEKVSIRELDAQYTTHDEWHTFKAQIQAEDEIWKWAAWGTIWFWLGGHHGYVIVRKGQVTGQYIVMN